MVEETVHQLQGRGLGDSFFDAWRKQLRVVNHFVAHAAGACAIALVVSGVAWFFNAFAHHFSSQVWLANTPYAFTAEKLVEISDLFIFVAFLVSGIVSVTRELMR